MTDIAIDLFSCLYIIRTVKAALFQLYIWQIKEYRFDRVIIHLKSSQGKKILLNPLSIFKWAILSAIFLTLSLESWNSGLNYSNIGNTRSIIMLYALLLFVFIVEGITYSFSLSRSSWKVPKFTPKIIIISLLIVTYTSTMLFFIFKLHRNALYAGLILLLVDKSIAILTATLILVSNLPKYIYTKLLMQRAKKKIQAHKNLLILGITGSVGKTSTKDFAHQIISVYRNTVSTPESNNVDIAIAKTILDKVTANTQVLIIEIGAYRKGEIRNICDMVRPNVGVITWIGTQHLDLFGGQQQLEEAKSELLLSMLPGSTAIINTDNYYAENLIKLAKANRLKIASYGIKNKNSDIFADEISLAKDGIEFTLHADKKSHKCRCKLRGIQNIPNILAAICLARAAGLNIDDIVARLSSFTTPAKTMSLREKVNGYSLIDDTFNSSKDSLIAAIEYMKLFTGYKVLVFNPVIEMGEKAEEIHEEIGYLSAKICDAVFVTNDSFKESLLRGARKIDEGDKRLLWNSGNRFQTFIRNHNRTDSVIVFEGKEAGKYISKLQ